MNEALCKKKYEEEAIKLAFDFCPPIKPCKDCKWPVVKGYCCTFCGSADP